MDAVWSDYEKEIRSTYLIKGVTGSGKTEVYIHLIEETIRQGKQVLYLLPEIALTAQITERLQRVFGSRLGIYHSKFPDAERVEIWQKQLSEAGYDIILGVRSSVFLPFRNLGLVIVDEEHEKHLQAARPCSPLSCPQCSHCTRLHVWRQNSVGHGNPFRRDLAQCHIR